MNAESSTIKQVSGALRLAGFWVISSITFLRETTPSYSRNQMRGDVCERQHLFGASPLNRHARHAEDRTTLFVLRNRMAAGFANLAQAGRAITAHARHNHCRSRRAEALGNRFEQHIHRRHV